MSEELLRILAVSGSAIEKVETTSAQIRLGIEARGQVATEVQQEIARKSSAVVELLRSQNVEQLKTTKIDLRTYPGDNNNRDLIKYFGNNTITFYAQIDDVGILIDETVKAGVSRIDGVSFKASPEAIFTAKQEALRKATIDAKTKAEVVLSTLDFRLKEIISIEVDQTRLREIRPNTGRRQARRSSAVPPGNGESSSEMPVVPGEVAVNASVTLQISY